MNGCHGDERTPSESDFALLFVVHIDYRIISLVAWVILSNQIVMDHNTLSVCEIELFIKELIPATIESIGTTR